MTGNTSVDDGAGGGQRRVGQLVVVAVCVLSLVLAGAIAPSVGSPFQDGPALNVSQIAGDDVANALQNESQGGGNGSLPQNASQDAGDLASQAAGSSQPNVVGSPKQYPVGGAQSLANFSRQRGNIQFVAEAPTNTYYRVGAYRSFDGYGWSRPDDQTAFSGAVPGSTPQGNEMTMRVTLNTSAYAVPVPWKPTSVEGSTPLSVRETGGIVPRESLRANESFVVTAVEPTRDPEVLADTWYDYPRRIEDGYLDVSGNVSPRVEALADRVTANASNPYEEAVAIEAWLEANKNYSLSATTDPGRPVTRQFLFEMDAGYCQYFASSMAVMLRSQGVPARYVVGYAPGTPIGEDTYAVTGSKAHAWVEVYFEGVGWVRFDPTPASGRESADEQVASQSVVQESFQSSGVSDAVNGSDFEPSGSGSSAGSPGETSGNGTDGSAGGESGDGGDDSTVDGTDDGGSTDDDGSTGDESGDGGDGSTDAGTDDDGSTDDGGSDDSDAAASGDVVVSLNRSAAPGADVEVSVTRGGEPVSFVTVYFNGEYAGTTAYDGTIVATVPYVRNLTVRVEGVNESTRARATHANAGGLTATTHAHASGLDAAALSGDATRWFDVERIPDDAFDPARSLDLEGAAASRSPDNDTATEEFRVSGNMTFALADDPVLGETVRMQVSIQGRPVPRALVRVDGERVGRTNASGWVRVDLPSDARNVTVAAERGEVSDSAEIALLTTADVTVEGGAVPGADLRVTATYDDEPLADAAVFVIGERVATTDAAGMTTVTVPTDATDEVTVTVERGVIAGETSKAVVANATIEFVDPPSPGESVTAAVTAANRSVAGATVRVDGEVVGETDASGLASVPVPADATGNATISASLGALSTTRTVDLFEPNVTVMPAFLVPLPGTSVKVNVTDAGLPVEGAEVQIGDASGFTGADGTVELGLPMGNAATVSVSAMGADATQRLDWLWGNLLVVAALLGVVVVVAVGSVVDRGVLGRAARFARQLARHVGRAAMDALFAIASRVDDLVAWLPSLPAVLRGFVERLVAAPVRTLRDVASRFGTWLAAVALGVVAWLRGLLDGEGLAGLSDDALLDAAGTGGAGGTGADGDDGGSLLSLGEAWRVLVSVVSPSRLRTRTPAEIGRLALDMGLPRDAVATLTDAYQRAVYGGENPDDQMVAAAADAAQTVERAATADATDEDGAGHDAATDRGTSAVPEAGGDAA